MTTARDLFPSLGLKRKAHRLRAERRRAEAGPIDERRRLEKWPEDT